MATEYSVVNGEKAKGIIFPFTSILIRSKKVAGRCVTWALDLKRIKVWEPAIKKMIRLFDDKVSQRVDGVLIEHIPNMTRKKWGEIGDVQRGKLRAKYITDGSKVQKAILAMLQKFGDDTVKALYGEPGYSIATAGPAMPRGVKALREDLIEKMRTARGMTDDAIKESGIATCTDYDSIVEFTSRVLGTELAPATLKKYTDMDEAGAGLLA